MVQLLGTKIYKLLYARAYNFALYLERLIQMSESNKIPTAPYILDIRHRNLTYDAAVERILRENKIVKAPIPVVHIATQLGFSVYSSSFEDDRVAGIMADSSEPVAPFEEKRVMVINNKDYTERQNFTVAHEIAHFVLHCNSKDNFFERYRHGLDKNQRPEIENSANAFAAALLMPEKMVRDFVSALPQEYIRTQIISAIAKKFIVPDKAAERRLQELNI